MIDACDLWCAKGGAGSVIVKLLKGWVWDRDSKLTEIQKRERFEILVRYTEILCAAHPKVFRLVQKVSFDQPDDTVMARLLTPGIALKTADIQNLFA